MKIAAVICELNPFHNGHAYLFRKLREEHRADYIIALMSGNYVQRGEPACMDKYVRTRMALGPGSSSVSDSAAESAGAYCDLVLQIPTVFASASAEDFAAAGIALANACGCIDLLGFGIEAPATLSSLRENARKLLSVNTESFADDPSSSPSIRKMLDTGITYPAALSEVLGLTDYTPNNILATEYLRAMLESGSKITPAPVYRLGEAYHSTILPESYCASATALRNLLAGGDQEAADSSDGRLAPYVPEWTLPIYKENSPYTMTADSISLLLSAQLLKAGDLSLFADVSNEIANRLARRSALPMSFTARVHDTKTRQYTYTRISRALLHIALGITKKETEAQKKNGYVSALRILGFRKDASPLLSLLKKSALLPIVSKTADAGPLLERELYFDHLYLAALAQSFPQAAVRSEYEQSPVII